MSAPRTLPLPEIKMTRSAPTRHGFEIHIDWMNGGESSLARLGLELGIDFDAFPRDQDMIFMAMPLGVPIMHELYDFPGLWFGGFTYAFLNMPRAPRDLLKRLQPQKRVPSHAEY